MFIIREFHVTHSCTIAVRTCIISSESYNYVAYSIDCFRVLEIQTCRGRYLESYKQDALWVRERANFGYHGYRREWGDRTGKHVRRDFEAA